MIITENIKIKINSINNKYYKSLGYNIKNGDEIEIPINLLYKGSHSLIYVKCDICGKEKYIEYRHYLESSNYGYYSCSQKCAYGKNRRTNLEKYGFENASQSNIVKEKIIKTNLEKYGAEYYLQTEDKKDKTIKTNLQKYGFESHNQLIIVKNKKMETCLKNYGVKNPSQSNIIKNKKTETCLKNYGVTNSSKSTEIKEKTANSCLKKYGVKYINQLNEIKNKKINTCLKKYGVEYYYQSLVFKEKSKETCLKKYKSESYTESEYFKEKHRQDYFNKNGILLNERNYQYEQYRSKITCLTNKNKKILLENWDGYDYYDGEYIKNNFNLKSYDKNYPTVDHKISVYYGFVNNISVEEISRIENLCITKKYLNSKKNRNCYEGKKES